MTKKSNMFGDTIMEIASIGVASTMIGSSGATGSTKAALDVVPTMMALGMVNQYSKKMKW